MTAAREPRLATINIPEWAATIPPETVCALIERLRGFQAKEVGDGDRGSNSIDDDMRQTLLLTESAEVELRDLIAGLNEDERIDLIALSWLGRAEGSLSEWLELRAEAFREHRADAATYLIESPNVPEELTEALTLFGKSYSED
jgi:Protein of unknown function (DUF3775)